MNTIKNILELSVPLFILHAIEEYYTGLTQLDSFFQWASNITGLSVNTIYFGEQVLLIGLLMWTIYQPKKWLLVLIGLIFVFEFIHLTRAIAILNYYPGLITAIPILILGIFFWRELIKNYKRSKLGV